MLLRGVRGRVKRWLGAKERARHVVTAFVDSCIETVSGSAKAVARTHGRRPRVRQLLRKLTGKKRILVTTHMHPDPDALASTAAMAELLQRKLPASRITAAVKGKVAGGINENFVRLSHLELEPWPEGEELKAFDAVVLLDVQPRFAYSPLPEWMVPTAVIDHHRAPPKTPRSAYHDVRVEVGATCSIVFSYFKEMNLDISPLMAASLLYAIETDLAGAAGTPGELDNIALSSLTLMADTSALYQMRYFDLSQSYFQAFYRGIGSAQVYGPVVVSHLGQVDSMEKAAVVADALLRYEPAEWSFVTSVFEGRLITSLRSTGSHAIPASDMIKKMMAKKGQGGGHRMKAGGFVPLEDANDDDAVEKIRTKLRQRLLLALKLSGTRGQKLVVSG